MEILQFRGAIGPYVEPSPGRATLHLLKIAKREFVAELRAALMQKKNSRDRKTEVGGIPAQGQSRWVNISVEPLVSATDAPQYLILFEGALPSVSASAKLADKLRGDEQIEMKMSNCDEDTPRQKNIFDL